MARLNVRASMTAVAGACMMISRPCMERVGPFDERNFAVAYNDVDYCLRAREAGFRTLYTPFATLVHHGSASRGPDERGHARALGDQAALIERHGTEDFQDPYFSPWFNRKRSEPSYVTLDKLPAAR
jgi:GT2 family glycosyltransferase